MNVFWPDVDDTKNARQACLNAAGMAFFVAIVTGLVTWLQASGKINIFPGIEKMAFVDVGLFILIGIGLCFNSRVAAVFGLLLYIGERVFMIKMAGFQPSHVVGTVLFGLAFVNGVRGAFAWHENKKIENGENPVEIKEAVVVEKAKKVFPLKTVFLMLVLLVVAGAAYYFLIQKGSMPDMDVLKKKTNALTKKVTPKKSTKPLVAPEGPAIKLKLKSGRGFDGVLVKKNSEGYWIFIDGMGEVFFSINEVAEAS